MEDASLVDQNQLIQYNECSLTGIRINDIYQQPSFQFEFGRKYIILRNNIKLIVSLVKLFFGLLIILLQNTIYLNDVINRNSRQIVNPVYLNLFTYVLIIHSFISTIYFLICKFCFQNKKINIELAKDQDQIFTVQIPTFIQENDINSYLEYQIQYLELIQFEAMLQFSQNNLNPKAVGGKIITTLHKKYSTLKIISKLLFLIRTLYLFWGLSILFTDLSVDQNSGLYLFYNIYLIIVVLIELYLYFKLYVLIFLYLIMLPLLIYYEIKNCLSRRKQKQQIVDQCQEIKYQLKQDIEEQCSICLQNFQDQEILLVLICSDKHKFHKVCVIDWLLYQKDCPLCRKIIN